MREKSKINKTIYYIDKIYKNLLIKICSQALRFYKGAPIENMDIYNSFLSEVPKYVEAFDASVGISFKTFIGLKCKYYAMNFCRKHWSERYKIMNLFVKYNDEIQSDSDEVTLEEKELDLSVLTPKEKMLYETYIIKDATLKETAKKLKISVFKVKSLLSHIRTKLILQIRE